MFSASGSFGSIAGWTMIHLVWVVALIYVLHLIAQFVLRRFSDHVRYCAACAILGVIVIVSGFLIYLPYAMDRDWPVGQTIRELARHAGLDPIDTAQRDRHAEWVDFGQVSDRSSWRQFAISIEPLLAWSGVIWLLGILTRLVPPAIGTLALRWYVRRASACNIDLADPQFARIRSIVPGQVIPVRSTLDVHGPCTTGWWKPVILMPAGLLLQLAPYQLECILAHELAHIRRRDFLINVMQISVEAALFFHPCVWLISHRIRVLREACCDDLAIAHVGSPKMYAKTLLFVEQWRPGEAVTHDNAPTTAMAMSDTSVPERVKRLVQLKYQPARKGYSRFACTVAAVMMLLIIAFAPLSSVAEDYRHQESVFTKGLSRMVYEEMGLVVDNPDLFPALQQVAAVGRRGAPLAGRSGPEYARDDLAPLVRVASRGALPDQVMLVRLHALRFEAGRAYSDPSLQKPTDIAITQMGDSVFDHALAMPAGPERLTWVRAAVVLAGQDLWAGSIGLGGILTHKRFAELSELSPEAVIRLRRYLAIYLKAERPASREMKRMIRHSPDEIAGLLAKHPHLTHIRYYAAAGIAAVTEPDAPARLATVDVLRSTNRAGDRKLAELLGQPLTFKQAAMGEFDPKTRTVRPAPTPLRIVEAEPTTAPADANYSTSSK